MSVYVGTIEYPFGRIIMFHLIADTVEELHEMVDRIGVSRKWFQNKKEHGLLVQLKCVMEIFLKKTYRNYPDSIIYKLKNKST